MKNQVESILNLLPEVTWDRYSGEEDSIDVFGWIKRDDGRSDFVVLGIKHGEAEYFETSSAKYSKEFATRLEFTHSDCKRVEDNFPNVKSVKLQK